MKNFIRTVALVFAAIFCLSSSAIAKEGWWQKQLPAPNYDDYAAWAAFPGQPNNSTDTPQGVPLGQSGDVDVFFIHPTTYLAPVSGNAAYDAKGEVGSRVDDVVLRYQASVFNGCCRIFAPRYRQASLHSITDNSPKGYAAADLAYSDVARAFDVFIRNNGGRPFILASHSQGSIHGLRLLQEKIVGTPLQSKLVAAYIIGVALPLDIERIGLPICRSAEATGCVITWNSVQSGHVDTRRLNDSVIWWQGRYQPIAGRPIVCVNPLNWTLNGIAGVDENLGGEYSDGERRAMPAPVPGVTGAACENGLLGVDVIPSERHHFKDILTWMGVYHDFDYGLYYMNIRENAALRASKF